MSSAPIYVLLRNDDLGALSDAEKEREVLERCARYGARMVVAVIPNNVEDPHVAHGGSCHSLDQNPAVVELALDYERQGLLELAQHGYTHQTNPARPAAVESEPLVRTFPGIDRPWAPYAPVHPEGYSEFSGLDVEAQREKVVRGRELLEQVLGRRPKSFIFPWNTFDVESMRVLRQEGYRFVPGEDEGGAHGGLWTIGCCVWDWEVEEGLPFVEQLEACSSPVLAHFGFHSWEYYDEERLARLEGVLSRLAASPRVRFVLPSELPGLVPRLGRVLSLEARMRRLERRLAELREEPLTPSRYYVLRPSFYVRRIAGLRLALAVEGTVGRARRAVRLALGQA